MKIKLSIYDKKHGKFVKNKSTQNKSVKEMLKSNKNFDNSK